MSAGSGFQWTHTLIGSALHDEQRNLVAKLAPRGRGFTARWCNGMKWDVRDQAPRLGAAAASHASRWFEAKSAAVLAVERALKAVEPNAVFTRSKGSTERNKRLHERRKRITYNATAEAAAALNRAADASLDQTAAITLAVLLADRLGWHKLRGEA